MFGHQHPSEFQTVERASSQMRLVPMRNERAQVSYEVDNRLVVLEVDLNYHGPARLMARMFKASQQRRVQLDGLALEVWRLVDGDTSVESIIDTMIERHLLTFFEARGLVFWYLQLLTERGVVAIALPEDGKKAEQQTTPGA